MTDYHYGKPLLFYDIEVLKKYYCLVFIDEKDKVYKFVNTMDGVSELIRNYCLVGYNNYHYDDVMISYMIEYPNDSNLYKKVNDSIIVEKNKLRSNIKHSLDVSQEINATKISLKQIQLNLGENIHESTVSFNLDRALTAVESKEMLEYCINDVKFTKKLFNYKERLEYFKSKCRIVQMFDLNESAMRYTTSTLCGIGFANENTKLFAKSDCIKIINTLKNIPIPIKNNWIDNLHLDNVDKSNWKLGDNVYNFTFGALSMSNKKNKVDEIIKHIDFASLFPTIVCNYNLLGEKTELYNKLRTERVKLKKTDPLLANVYKLLLNKTYGVHGSKYNKLYNKYIMYTICFIAQDLLYGLCSSFAQNRVLNAKTDGLYVLGDVEVPEVDGYTLDSNIYTTLIQRDVNSYIAVNLNGEVMVKGSHSNFKSENVFARENDLAVCNLAVVNKLLYNIDIIDTLIENLDKPLLFQKTVKHGKTFNYVASVDEDGTLTRLSQKVNRAFATKNGNKFVKVKEVDGLVKSVSIDTKFKGSIWNKQIDKSCVDWFKESVELDYYYNRSLDILKEFQS